MRLLTITAITFPLQLIPPRQLHTTGGQEPHNKNQRAAYYPKVADWTPGI